LAAKFNLLNGNTPSTPTDNTTDTDTNQYQNVTYIPTEYAEPENAEKVE
jgi:hypothetical protein